MSERKDRSDGMSKELAELKRELEREERERRLMLLGWAIGGVVAGLYYLVHWWLA